MNQTVPAGFSLIEVLVSLMLLSLALLGMDAMEIFALRENRSAYYFSLANAQMESITEHLRAIGLVDNASIIRAWNKENSILLPQGVGVVQGQFPTYAATLFWGDPKTNECKITKKGNSGCLKKIINL